VTFLNAGFPALLFAVPLLNWKYFPLFWNPYTTISFTISQHVGHNTLLVFLIFKTSFTTNILRHVVFCCIVSCLVVLCCIVSCRVVLNRIVSCSVVSYRVVLCRVVLCSTVLCCVVSCCFVSCCVA